MIKAIIFCLVFILIVSLITGIVNFIYRHFPDLFSTILSAPLKFFK